MHLIDINEITLAANRQRREFDLSALHDLREGIEHNGLFNPLTIRTIYDEANKGKTIIQLVAGERRMRAVKALWDLGGTFTHDGIVCAGPLVPCCGLGELDPLAAEEAELEENINRVDLSWQERADATARLHNLRERQATAAGLPPPTVANTSVEVRGSSEGYSHEETRRELIVARHMADPEVAGAKTLDAAFKVLKRKETAQSNRDLAIRVGASFGASSHTALNEDSRLWLSACEEGRFDVILTDPPYGMGADEFGDAGGRTGGEHQYEDSELVVTQLLAQIAPDLFRVAKAEAHLYVFCDIDRFFFLRDLFSTTGWWVHRTPIIWCKPQNARLPWPENGPQRKWEMLLYAVKGKKRTTRIAPDLVTYNPDSNLGHMAQKPVNLFLDLLSRSVKPGDTVLDPFMGTGTIFPAAHELKCLATGIEKDPASYGIAVGRLGKLDQQGELLSAPSR